MTGIRWWLVAAAVLTVRPVVAQQPASVWINTRSGVYHCPGAEHYGKTARGEYLAEPLARSRGYRPNGGRWCGPVPPGFDPAAAVPDRSPPRPPDSLLAPCRIIRIVDGDTLECEGRGAVRPIGPDAPERDQEPHASRAAAALATILPIGTTVLVQDGDQPRDRSGRLLAYLWVADSLVNWVLIRQGWAVHQPFADNARYAAWFAAAEARARAENRGLWPDGGLDCRPRAHRARHC